MFKYRAISFPTLLALLAAIIFWHDGGPYLFVLVAAAAFGLVLYETGAMLRGIGVNNRAVTTAVAGGVFFLFLLAWMGNGFFRVSPALLLTGMGLSGAVLAYGGWVSVLFGGERREVLSATLCSTGIFFWLFIPLFLLATVYMSYGARWMLFVILVTKMMDTGGYICGMLSARWMKNGNHKILPKISPKKSWEGTLGGIVFSVVTAFLFWKFAARGPLFWYLLTAVVLALGSFAGDLTESALKRCCGVKDSGHWIPGMGGVFDVLDSFLYNGILFWLMMAAI